MYLYLSISFLHARASQLTICSFTLRYIGREASPRLNNIFVRLTNIPKLGDFLIFDAIGRFPPFPGKAYQILVSTPALEPSEANDDGI